MPFRIALAKTCHPKGGDVVALVEDVAARAKSHGADIVVFPESLMSRFESERQRFLAESQPIDGAFAQAVDEIALKQGIWILYTMNEANPEGGRPFNTAILTDSTGTKQAVYRKVHLFDSSAVKESERMSASSNEPVCVNTPFGKIGLGICYDLRFPEFSRRLTLEGCELLFYPAAWVDGELKELQWKTLLTARSIENQIFVVGVSRADEGYVGTGYVFAPTGEQIAKEVEDDLLVSDIRLDDIEKMRSAIPCLEHRRPELY